MKMTSHDPAPSATVRTSLRLSQLALLAAFAVSLAACKKPEDPAQPAPQAAQNEVTQSDSGTTTTFAPPADEPGAPATPAQ